MSDTSLLAFAVLFMFCLRKERLLQTVLTLTALKCKVPLLLLIFLCPVPRVLQRCFSTLLGVPGMKSLQSLGFDMSGNYTIS